MAKQIAERKKKLKEDKLLKEKALKEKKRKLEVLNIVNYCVIKKFIPMQANDNTFISNVHLIILLRDNHRFLWYFLIMPAWPKKTK